MNEQQKASREDGKKYIRGKNTIYPYDTLTLLLGNQNFRFPPDWDHPLIFYKDTTKYTFIGYDPNNFNDDVWTPLEVMEEGGEVKFIGVEELKQFQFVEHQSPITRTESSVTSSVDVSPIHGTESHTLEEDNVPFSESPRSESPPKKKTRSRFVLRM